MKYISVVIIVILSFLLSLNNNADKMITSTRFPNRKDVDVNLSNKAGLTALHLACQAGDTHLVCICQEEANSKELSSFNAETFPDKITSSTKIVVEVILKISMPCFAYHVSWMDWLARTK